MGIVAVRKPRGFLARELPGFILVALLAILVWCVVYNRWSASAWRTPVMYKEDALSAMAFVKAMAEGEIAPILPKFPVSLGAPFIANWNDFPIVEEGIFAWWALLVRLFGVSAGASFVLLSAHTFAALSFYGVCRYVRYDRMFAAAGALLFAFSPFALYRNLQHLPLTYFWHIPLGILVLWLCTARFAGVLRLRRVLLYVGTCIAFGFQNPYYIGIFLQFLVFAALWQFARGGAWRRVILPLVLVGTTALTFLVANADTFMTRAQAGPNHGAVLRSYQNLEFYALKPIELLLARSHRIDAIETVTRDVYMRNSLYVAEVGSPYLGWIGAAGLLWMIWRGFAAIARRDVKRLPTHLIAVVWVLLYSIVGGINGIVGFAVQYFRATNRYSIVILAFVLLFLVRELTRFTTRQHWLLRAAIAITMVAVGLLDHWAGAPPVSFIKETARQISRDRAIVRKVEAALPPNAMIFQLPVREFPEGGGMREMGDHEHFRPYLFSKNLRFSYGSHKGRSLHRWQGEADAFGVTPLVHLLERYGFAAVWINRKAYEDRAAALMADFRTAEKYKTIAKSADFVCIALDPVPHPVLPPEFPPPWSGIEGSPADNWRWSAGSADVILHNGDALPKQVRLSCGIATLQPRVVEVLSGAETLARAVLDKTNPFGSIEFTTTLQPGPNRLHFRTDAPGAVPGNGDPRSLAFRIQNFRLDYSPAAAAAP